MIKNPFAKYDFSNPFGTDAMKRSRNLFGVHTTPRDWKHGARDIPFGMGAASLHVDGTDGDDSNDGESWITAKKTIQEAVDAADSWTYIYIKAGTYAESVSISKDNIHLVAAKQWVDIDPAGEGIPVTISAHQTVLQNIHALGATAVNRGAYEITGNLNQLINCKCTNGVSQQGVNISGNQNLFSNLSNTASIQYVIYLTGNENIFENCKFSGSATSWYAIGVHSGSDNNKIHNNTFENFSNASGSVVWLSSSALHNRLYHNNFLSNNRNIYTNTATLICLENFYSDHTNVDNGSGIATTPYAFTGGSDLRPVITRDGWNSISILRSILRKKTATQTSQAATDANGTSWVDLKTIAPTTSDIELHRLKMTTAGSWIGTAKYRIIIGSTKVYPFPADKNIDSGNIEDLIFPINVQINETAKIQFRSNNAGDGAGETVALNQLDYATVL